MSTFALVSKQTALLVMHYQTNIMTLFPSVVSTLLSNACALCDATRAKGISVYFAGFHFNPGYPGIGPLNKSGQGAKQLGLFVKNRISPGLDRQPNESIIIAHRASVLYDTDLQVWLSTKGIDILIMVGVASTGVILSSVARASNTDYRLFTVKNCCYDPDPIVHEHFFATAFKSHTTVLSLADTLSLLG